MADHIEIAAGDDIYVSIDDSVAYQVRFLYRIYTRHLQDALVDTDITVGMYYFLRILWEQDGLSQTELSQSAGMTEPTTMTAINMMESKGIVKRVRDENDKRRYMIELTEKGRSLKLQILPRIKDINEKSTRTFSENEVDKLIDGIKRLQFNLLVD